MHARLLVLAVAAVACAAPSAPASPQAVPAAAAPAPATRLVFVHHSVGENWLNDGYGGLAAALQRHRYFVSDTNYGWGPNAIGDRTDIPNWLDWFRSRETPAAMAALLRDNGVRSPYARTLANPGGRNRIVLFKSCYPNSSLAGRPNDPPRPGRRLTVSNAKYVYNELLKYFRTRPGTLFVVVTAPPNSDRAHAANARAFNTWLVRDWLDRYPLRNVAVFDFYNVLTAPGSHHRLVNGRVQHVHPAGRNTTAYPSGDDHPNAAGSRKATREFVPLLDYFVRRWRS